MTLLLALLMVAIPIPADAKQSPYELDIGMPARDVDALLGTRILKRVTQRSADSDEEWEGSGFSVYLCKKIVTTVMIELPGDIDQWITAVSREYKERGPPEFERPEPILHTIEVSWTLRNGSELRYVMQALKGETHVTRWLSAKRGCPTD